MNQGRQGIVPCFPHVLCRQYNPLRHTAGFQGAMGQYQFLLSNHGSPDSVPVFKATQKGWGVYEMLGPAQKWWVLHGAVDAAVI